MNNRITRFLLVLSLIAVILAACGGSSTSTETEESTAVDSSMETAQVEATAEPEETPADQEEATEPTEEQADSAAIDEAVTTIVLDDTATTITGDGASVSGSIVTISSAGAYNLSGTLNDGQVVVESDDDASVYLVLDGINLNNSGTSPLYIDNAGEVVIELSADSENIISDDASYVLDDETSTEPNAAIYSRVDLSVIGSGTLNLTTAGMGINSATWLTIDEGTFVVDSADSAIHSDNDLIINGGNFTLATGNDGIHADYTLTINDGVINITESEEGIESTVITLNGGAITLVSTDDGVNASNSDALEGLSDRVPDDLDLIITGGTLVVDAAGDGIDSNGDINMSGGLVIVNGPTENADGALDYDGIFTITGGTLVATGSSGMAEAPSSVSTQNSLLVNFDEELSAGTLVHIESADGDEVLTFAPTKTYQSVAFSSPDLVLGETYSVYYGGAISGDAFAGLYEVDGYEDGALFIEVTLDSSVTTYGEVTSGRGQRSTDGEQPDLTAAAEQLGVTEEVLMDALSDSSQDQGQPDFEAAAEAIGVSAEALEAALMSGSGAPDDGAPAEQPADSSEQPTDSAETSSTSTLTFPIVDTEQTTCYDNSEAIDCPDSGDFYGQDAQYAGNAQSYTINATDDGDETVTDNVTGIMWTKSPDMEGIGNNDGEITSDDKLSSSAAATACEALDYAGYTDWQLPNIKQLYSLMNFQGIDPTSDDTSTLTPFIDWDYFDFAYGSTENERIIDSQYATTSLYTNDEGTEMMFGVNFADGRIKGYEEEFAGGDKTYFVMCMRGNTDYGENDFVDNGDGTITDNATGLMWAQDDSGSEYAEGFDYTTLDFLDEDGDGLLVPADTDMNGAMTWEDALSYVQALNEAEYLGYSDWRLPNVKELHSLMDYSKTPANDGVATIDEVFNSTAITNENGDTDYPFYWSGTTHATDGDSEYGVAGSYVAFGRAMGYSEELGYWIDVHGAGAQRSDEKTWDGGDYTSGDGPQNDAVRIYHYVRLVRGDDVTETPDGDPNVLESSDSAMAETDGQEPDMAAAAEQLGVTEDELKAALGDPSDGAPDFEAAAEILGVTTEELESAIGMGADEEAITIDAYTVTFNGIDFEITYELFSWADLPSDVVYERQPIESYTNADGTTHWYEAVYVETGNLNWYQVANLAQESGGYLASITSEGENSFVFDLVSDEKYFWSFDEDGEHYGISIGPFLGGYQPEGSEEPDGGWSWLSGEAWDYTKWAVNLDDGVIDKDPRDSTQPNDSGDEVGSQPIMGFGEMNVPVPTWGDYMDSVGTYGLVKSPGSNYGFIIEYETEPATATDNTESASTDAVTATSSATYTLNETGQGFCYNSDGENIDCPAAGEAFYGQDAQFTGAAFDFIDNGDGTVTDNVTGLTWEQSPNSGPSSWPQAQEYCEALTLGDLDDWRMPSLKELFSISNFSAGWPYLDTAYFDLTVNDSISKDEQYWSSNYYVGKTVEGQYDAAFGVNHATGHIKAYPALVTGPMGKYVRCVSGEAYGINDFVDNGDGTITDATADLMWMQADSGEGMDWETALAYAQEMNAADYLGYSDWRLPNVKELQSIVDYDYAPDAQDAAYDGPALNPLFSVSEITNEAGELDYPYYWTSTSARFQAGGDFHYAWYVAAGRAVDGTGADSHGAGAVRFDVKVEGGPAGEGDERVYNYVRLVRGGDVIETPDGDPNANDTALALEFSSGGEPGSGEGGQPGGPQQPDFAAAAATLGVSEGDLIAALENTNQSPPDFEAAAEALGVSVEELETALMDGSDAPPEESADSSEMPADSAEQSADDATETDAVVIADADFEATDWTEATHSNDVAPNFEEVFDDTEVKRFDVVVSEENWQLMLDDMTARYAEFGQRSRSRGLLDTEENPIWVPADVFYNGTQWYQVGLRFKGNSSLQSPWQQGNLKLPFKLDFDEFEDDYPQIDNQRFYGFKQLSLKNNFEDESFLREKVAADVFEDAGLAVSHTAFYELYMDRGDGPEYFGLYTLVEEVDDTVIETQFTSDNGNLYKPEEGGANFVEGAFSEEYFEKQTNEDEADWSDILALFDTLHDDTATTDPAIWRTNLEAVDVEDGFLRYLAVNGIIQNWDTYGRMPHNYYLYNDPETSLLTWIPWDNNEAFQEGKRGGALNLDFSDLDSASWPLIAKLYADDVYRAQYDAYLSEVINDAFETSRIQALYETYADLIEPSATAEQPGFTFLDGEDDFANAIDDLIDHAESRADAVNAYLGGQ